MFSAICADLPKGIHTFNEKKMQSMKLLNSAPLPSISAPLPSIPSRGRQGSKLSGYSARDTCDGIELGQVARLSRSITRDERVANVQMYELKHDVSRRSRASLMGSTEVQERDKFAKLPPIQKAGSEAEQAMDALPNRRLNKKLPGNAPDYTAN